MKLTPLDIKKQEFKTIFRGYDRLEVETFLEMVANEYEDLLNERNQLKNEVLTLQTQLKDYQQVEQTLKQTLMNAQESVNRARVNTEKEANLILHEAELKAEKILEKARHDLERIKNELVLIRAQKESFAQRLRHLLESQIELIKVLEIDDLEAPPSTSKETKKMPGVKPTGTLLNPPPEKEVSPEPVPVPESPAKQKPPSSATRPTERREKSDVKPAPKKEKEPQKQPFSEDDQMVF